MDAIAAFKKALAGRYGGRLAKIYVFGSVARGDDKPGSDIDILVVLDGEAPASSSDEMGIRDCAYDVELGMEVVFDIKALSTGDMATPAGRTPFMESVMREGVAV
jgi:predicted nucleotidyltransferase